MRKYLLFVTIMVLPVAAVRFFDILFFIDWETGYAARGGIYLRAALSLILVIMGCYSGFKRRRSQRDFEIDIESTNSSIERSSIPAGIFFLVAGFATASAEVGVAYDLISNGEIQNVLKSNAELLRIGSSKLFYILLIISTALGVLVAFWHLLIGSWFFRGEGHFAGGRFISIFIAVWYYIRIINDFIRYPVNPNNTTSLALVFSVLILALFYTKFTKVVSTDFPLSEEPSLFCFGVISFLWVVGVGAPTAVILVQHNDTSQLLMLAADVFASLAALGCLYARLPAKPETETSKPGD